MHPLDDLFVEVEARIKSKYADAHLIRFDRVEHHTVQIAAMIEWSLKVDNPKLKVQTLAASLRFLGDRCEYLVIDLSFNSFDYADPDFPDVLYRRLGV